MKKLYGLILFVFLSVFGCISSFQRVYAKIYTYGAFYQSYLDYKNSKIKDYGSASTLYLSIGDGLEHGVELGVAYTYIKYKTSSNLSQTEFTFLYSNTNGLLQNHTFTWGIHYINTTDKLTDNGYVLILDGTYFATEKVYPYGFKWNGGFGVFYSRYQNLLKFYVFQLTPHATVKLFSDVSKGAFYFDAVGYYIYVNKANLLNIDKSNYFSIDLTLRYYYGRYHLKLGGWIGEQIFAVKNRGFVVYNLTERYKRGMYGEIGYAFRNGVNLGFTFQINRYREYTKNATQYVGTISIGCKF